MHEVCNFCVVSVAGIQKLQSASCKKKSGLQPWCSWSAYQRGRNPQHDSEMGCKVAMLSLIQRLKVLLLNGTVHIWFVYMSVHSFVSTSVGVTQ